MQLSKDLVDAKFFRGEKGEGFITKNFSDEGLWDVAGNVNCVYIPIARKVMFENAVRQLESIID